MSFDYTAFCAIAKTARTRRDAESVTALLANYAASGCAIYPTDKALFLEHDLGELGYELVACWNAHSVRALGRSA